MFEPYISFQLKLITSILRACIIRLLDIEQNSNESYET